MPMSTWTNQQFSNYSILDYQQDWLRNASLSIHQTTSTLGQRQPKRTNVVGSSTKHYNKSWEAILCLPLDKTIKCKEKPSLGIEEREDKLTHVEPPLSTPTLWMLILYE